MAVMHPKDKKVVIGLVTRVYTDPHFYHWTFQQVNDPVRYVVNQNGGLVVGIFPQTPHRYEHVVDEHDAVPLTDDEKQDLLRLLANCDGVILPGGPTSHNYAAFVARYCYDHDVPLLGICAGYNNIIRALGGKAEKMAHPERHNFPDRTYVHGCHLTARDSLFYQIMGQDDLRVNSVHEYIGTVIPPALRVVAVDDEQNPEVVEAPDKRFYLGIKFHPELLVDDNPAFNRIFTALLAACRTAKN